MREEEMIDRRLLGWIHRQGWHDLRSIQREAIPVLLNPQGDVVIKASTAGGKTEAAFLPILTRMAQMEGQQPLVIAVAPLKALINDQARRLEDMAEPLGIKVTAWHGDAAQSGKNEFLRHPSGVLLITPESLEAILSRRSPWARKAFRDLQYIVVDELHAFQGNERGTQLQQLMARLDMIAGRRLPRVGLSATIPTPEENALVIQGSEKHPVQILVKEIIADADHQPEPLIAQDLFSRLRGTNNLVFTNSRKDAEAFRVALGEISRQQGVPDEFRIHHGSLSHADRSDVEKELQAGERPVTAICTASMELGVDIGKVKSIAQIGTAQDPASLRQRLGRSGRRGEPSILRVYSVDEARDDYKYHLRANLLQNIAVIELLRSQSYQDIAQPSAEANLSVIVQQLLSLLGEHGSYYASEAFMILCRGEGAFPYLSEEDFESLLKEMERKRLISRTNSGQIVVGREGERLMGSRDFYSAFTTPADYTIVDRTSKRVVGAVQYKPYYGEVFILAGEKWIVDAVEERSSTAWVSQTHSKGKMMFEGTGPETSPSVVHKMREILGSDQKFPYLDPATATAEQLESARLWYRAHALDHQPWVRQGDTLAWLTWAGMKANRVIAMLAHRFLGVNPPYDHIAVAGLTPDQVTMLSSLITQTYAEPERAGSWRALPASAQPETAAALSGQLSSPATELASSVPRVKKERGKWDQYLPDELLNRQYAAQKLDLQGAIQALSTPILLPDSPKNQIK
ncbi:MAG: DEAD/DEAH box helicase [Bacteroidales bacterium]|nr:DEAD/DEAH box helicase [Bacteroidales bacterium]